MIEEQRDSILLPVDCRYIKKLDEWRLHIPVIDILQEFLKLEHEAFERIFLNPVKGEDNLRTIEIRKNRALTGQGNLFNIKVIEDEERLAVYEQGVLLCKVQACKRAMKIFLCPEPGQDNWREFEVGVR